MKSLRLNRKGEVIPSVVKEPSYNHAWEGSDDYMERYTRPNWTAPVPKIGPPAHLRRLEDINNDLPAVVGIPLSPERIAASRGARLLSFLAGKGRYSVGDWVCDVHFGPDSAALAKPSISIIIAIERDNSKVVWKQGFIDPFPFLLVQLPSMWVKQGDTEILRPAWARWSDLAHKRHLTQNEVERLVHNDDFIPHYLEQVKAALKNGSLDVS